MLPLSDFKNPHIKFVFTDIDDTLTENGKLGPEAYEALWSLEEKGVKIIPVTGRPAGWCEMIARFWPVDGVIGENGGLYFRCVENSKSGLTRMVRVFAIDEKTRNENRKILDTVVAPEVLSNVPGSAVASDQFSRIMDLAIDFCEDVKPLADKDVQKIVEIFETHKARAKISSIHVNGWFGDYDKLSMCRQYMKDVYKIDLVKEKEQCAFVGDSPNDEPMFGFFTNSFGVANIDPFIKKIKSKPTYISDKRGGSGFSEIAQKIITCAN